MQHTVDHLEEAIHPHAIHVKGFNTKVALFLTQTVGTMWCFWAFLGLSLISLPAVIATGSILVLVSWITQTCIQLILLPALMVGQNLQNVANDHRAEKTFKDVELVLDRLDTKTEGGLHDVLMAIERGRRDSESTAAGQADAPVAGLPEPVLE